MDALPDDVLLAVLRLLPLREAVGARRVCRRWRDLALHPDLWRRQAFYARLHDGMLYAALRLAPCVAELSFSEGLADFGVAAVSTACAAAELGVTLKCQGDAVLAVMAIRNQVALGRLKSLILIVCVEKKGAALGRGLADLFTEIHQVQGLTKLWVSLSSRKDFQAPLPMSGAVVPGQLLPPSLTDLTFRMMYHASQLRPHLEFQLASHAATLRRVLLEGTGWAPRLQASIFNSMPNLEELECPLLEDMHLLKSVRLRKLLLCADYPRRATTESSLVLTLENAEAVVFFRGATDLLDLDLTMWHDTISSTAFVSALASSGRSKLEVLRLTHEQIKEPGLLRLDGLPSLKKIKVCTTNDDMDEDIPDSLLEFLGRVSLPSLSILRGSVECFHNYLQQSAPALEAAMRKNPQLHILTYAMCCEEEDYDTQCAACAAGGCEEAGFTRGACVGVCAHPADGNDCCAVREIHAKGDYKKWFCFLQDAI